MERSRLNLPLRTTVPASYLRSPKTYCFYDALKGRGVVKDLSDVPNPSLQSGRVRGCSAHRSCCLSILRRPGARTSPGRLQAAARDGRFPVATLATGRKCPRLIYCWRHGGLSQDHATPSREQRRSKVEPLQYPPWPPRGSGPPGPAHGTYPFRVRVGTHFRPAFLLPSRRK